jgi:hypothetical protein
MSTSPTFSPRALGQTEKALNAILDRRLAGTGLSEHRWITLSLLVMSGGRSERDALLTSAAGALKIGPAEAAARLGELVAAQLVQPVDPAGVEITAAGEELFESIRGDVVRITDRLWGDLPADDLAAAGRVLDTVLARANAELAGSAA